MRCSGENMLKVLPGDECSHNCVATNLAREQLLFNKSAFSHLLNLVVLVYVVKCLKSFTDGQVKKKKTEMFFF